VCSRAREGELARLRVYTGGTEGRWNRGDHRERLGGRGATDPAEAAPGGSPPGPAASLDEDLREVRSVRRLRSRRQQQLVHVLHLRTIRVEQWSLEALTSASRRDFPVMPIRSARSKSGSMRMWSSSARGAGPSASRRSCSRRSSSSGLIVRPRGRGCRAFAGPCRDASELVRRPRKERLTADAREVTMPRT
jgi:hypothetical protein